ncbi:MAG: hypothetical protein H7Y22_03830 [Gemmatimonadaceae bacterium]|nr:hypothetical protein [Gloeobacterales cyanobacterium ES-bin-141]
MQLLSPKLTLSEKISLAQTSKILVRVEDDKASDALIYFIYRSRQTGRTHRYVLGYTWREAEYYLLDERNYQLRQLFEQTLYQHNLDKFTSLAEACFQQGPPTERKLEVLEHFCQKYDFPVAVAFQIVQSVKSGLVTAQGQSLKAPGAVTSSTISVRSASGTVPAAGPTTGKSRLSMTWKGGAVLAALLVALSGAFVAGKASTAQTPAQGTVARADHQAKPNASRKVANAKTRKAAAAPRSIAAR